jgi:hypothetical protein
VEKKEKEVEISRRRPEPELVPIRLSTCRSITLEQGFFLPRVKLSTSVMVYPSGLSGYRKNRSNSNFQTKPPVQPVSGGLPKGWSGKPHRFDRLPVSGEKNRSGEEFDVFSNLN